METDVAEPGDIREQIKMVSLTETDAKFAASLAKMLESSMDEIADKFYAVLLDNAKLKNMIHEHSTIERLKKTLLEHIRTMLNIRIDDRYVSKRKAIALKHLHIGLQSKWYVGSFGKLQNILLEVIVRDIADDDLRIRALEVVTKLLNFEQQIVPGGEGDGRHAIHRRQDEVRSSRRARRAGQLPGHTAIDGRYEGSQRKDRQGTGRKLA